MLLSLLLACLMGLYCFARGCPSSSVVVCNAAGGRPAAGSVTGRPPPSRALGRSGGRHYTAGQYL